MHDLLSMLKVTGTTGSREPLLMMQVTGVLPLVSTSVDLGRFGSLKLKLFRGDTITEALNRSLPPWLPENAVAAARAHLGKVALKQITQARYS